MAQEYTAPSRVRELIGQAYRLLEDAQAHADRWDRAGLGRDLDRVRWQVGDLAAKITPDTPDTGDEWDRSPFGSAIDRGQA